MHAWTEVCHLLQSSKSPLTGFLCSIGWRITGFLQTLPHTNSISNSAILRNNYISLLSDLCACVHVKKKWHRKGSHSSSVSGSCDFKSEKKAMRWCTALCKCCCFVWKPSWKVTQIWTSLYEDFLSSSMQGWRLSVHACGVYDWTYCIWFCPSLCG